MNREELNTRDALDRLIAERLGERQNKIECMDEWERRISKPRKVALRTYAGIAIAACMAIFLVMTPFHGREDAVPEELGIRPPSIEFRAASPDVAEISRLIGAREYDDALVITKRMLDRSDSIIAKSSVPEDKTDEETLYEMQSEHFLNSELRWTYIYLLVCTDEKEEAIRELERYLEQEEYCSYKDEAEALLKKMRVQ